MSDDNLYFNGIHGTTGQYLFDPMTLAEAAQQARGLSAQRGLLGWLRSVWDRITLANFGLPFGVKATDVASAGWAVVFHKDTPAAVRDALEPLIKHRQQHVQADRCKVLEYPGPGGGTGLKDWLRDYKVASGDVVPA